MIRIFLILLFTLFIHLENYAQSSYKYWIGFTDKKNNSFTINHPEKYLSQRSINRRTKQGITINELDIPVTVSYIDSIRRMGFFIQYSSKWLNGITVGTNDTNEIAKIKALSFVNETKLVYKTKLKNATTKKDSLTGTKALTLCSTPHQYGPSQKQIEIMNGHCLHQMGYRGEGMMIAVIDAGFLQVDSFPAFDSIWENKQIPIWRDFVNPSRDFFNTHSHGMSVLSIIGGNVPDTLIGTAPKSNFALVITEDGDSEYPIEEYNWSAGAEFADSIGADIINSSLGYNDFNDASMNHTYKDMDGNTTPCARAATIASSKGLIVVISAGNEGNYDWKKITTPGDAMHCLTIGAVDSFRHYASFSSLGPSSDGRIKPDIATMGKNTYNQAWNNKFSRGSGTSFAAPLAAGMVACLWQAFPDRNNLEIMDAIRESASISFFPNDSIGFGVADFDKAYTILNQNKKTINEPNDIDISPNPFRQQIKIDFNSIIEDSFTIEFIDTKGMSIYTKVIAPIYSSYYNLMNLDSLPQGVLICRIVFKNTHYTFKLIKI